MNPPKPSFITSFFRIIIRTLFWLVIALVISGASCYLYNFLSEEYGLAPIQLKK